MKYKSKSILFISIISFVLIFGTNTFAQYTENDSSLVASVFNRNLNGDLVDQYLSSNKKQKINAALLSIANSGDTSFVSKIISLDFRNHSDEIVFALKKLGPDSLSQNYLFEKSKNFDKRTIYDALGVIADSAFINQLLAAELSKANSNFIGLPLLIYQASIRGIKLDSASIENILLTELQKNNSQRKFDALFAIYRTSLSNNLDSLLIETLDQNLNTTKFPIAEYSLGCLRKMNAVPSDSSLFEKLISSKNWKIRTEFVRTYADYQFKKANELIAFASLISDENPNVAVQAAVSLRSIKFEESLEDTLLYHLKNIFRNDELSTAVKGELFISLVDILPNNKKEFFDDNKSNVEYQYIFESLANEIFEAEYVFEFIQNEVPDLDTRELQYAAQTLVGLQDSLGYDSEYRKSINTFLNSNFPHVVAVTSMGLDSAYVNSNYPILQQLIFEQILRNLNDPNFSETLMSLTSLAEKLGEDFAVQIYAMMKTSEMNSVKSFAADKLGEELEIREKRELLFDTIWSDAFKYSGAVISTNKGDFKIEFNNGVAPITVGNFIKLTEEEFFEDVLFHRVVPNFVIQTGDQSGTGWSGPGYEIVSEFSYLPFNRGTLGMASAGKDTEGSQWFVMHNNYPHLNGNYTVFGEVVDGIEIVDRIEYGDYITDIELIK